MPYSKLCEPFGPFGRQAAAPGIGRIDVVYGDVVKLAHDAMRQLVQKGMARMGNTGVAVARLTLFIGPLRLRQLVLDLFEVARVRHRSPVDSVAKSRKPRPMPTPSWSAPAGPSATSMVMLRHQLPRRTRAKLVPSLILPSGRGSCGANSSRFQTRQTPGW